MALPAIESLATAFPQAHIHAFAGRHSAPVFRESELISRVYITPDQLSASRASGLAWNLRTAGHDWIVLLDRSRWTIIAARAANPARLVKLPRNGSAPRHEIDIYLDALRAAGVPISVTVPRLTLKEETHAAVADTLAPLGADFAVLHPGGAENPGTSMPDKRWPADRMAATVRELAQRGLTPVLSGGPSDIEVCSQVARESGVEGCVDLSGKLSLMETAAVIQRARVYVGTDTGVSHLAAAVGTPSAVIFGPTNPLRYAPRGEHVRVLAPDASYALADADLRKLDQSEQRPSTSEISVSDILETIDELRHTQSGFAT